MEHTVKIPRAAHPDFDLGRLSIPTELQGRFHIDCDGQRLIFQGFMSKADYDRIIRLDRHVEYQRAVEELFRISTEAKTPPQRTTPRWPFVLAAGAVVVIGLFSWHRLGSKSTPPASPAAESAARAAEIRK